MRAFMQSLDEATWLAARALVQLQGRNCLDQTLIEARNLIRRDLLQRSESHVARDDGREAPVIRPAKGANAGDLELVGIKFYGWHEGEANRLMGLWAYGLMGKP